MNAKDAVRIAKEAKPAFLKFLEVRQGIVLRSCYFDLCIVLNIFSHRFFLELIKIIIIC